MNKNLIWFRNDLRVSDNPALTAAVVSADKAIAIYIHCPEQNKMHSLGDRQLQFIRDNLVELRSNLALNNIDLHEQECNDYSDVPETISKFIDQKHVSALFANRDMGINELQRDTAVRINIQVPFHRFNGDCIMQHGTLLTLGGDMFRVFTPFRNAWLKQLRLQGYALDNPANLRLAETDHSPGQHELLQWPAGEQAALDRLKLFCNDQMLAYSEQRDFPSIMGTSGLSPYLAVGVLSPRQCLQVIESTLGYIPMSPGEKGFEWLNELIWREFYRHLMVAYPRLSQSLCFKPEMDQLTWVNDEQLFQAWCDGETGFPIVDAAMRCLKQTGWMHNRLRMVVASFLTKDLQLNWLLGERYFMQQLIDADFASNNGGWQWAAGTGADAAPYFRIFNPTRQSEKFDTEGQFIKRWIRELENVPQRFIHQPYQWLKAQGPGETYPAPIVDHKLARQQTLQRYQLLKESS